MNKQMNIRYFVAFESENKFCVMVSEEGSKAGMDEGWYLYMLDLDNRPCIVGGPHATAEDALRLPSAKV